MASWLGERRRMVILRSVTTSIFLSRNEKESWSFRSNGKIGSALKCLGLRVSCFVRCANKLRHNKRVRLKRAVRVTQKIGPVGLNLKADPAHKGRLKFKRVVRIYESATATNGTSERCRQKARIV